MADDEERSNMFRILIATDNHLGVWEKDEVRKDDSFDSFEEVFQIAAQQQVDFVLLGGDLFHDNKPSRTTLVRAIDILSRYCLCDRPVTFEVLSDQSQNFVSGQVNFANANFNVGLPVFTIHGNHDDPAGADNLSAVDVLSTCNLVNYFGKVALSGSGIGNIKLAPVLIQKGYTKLALYGLGNIRDERLGRMFQTPGCVEWVRPAEMPGYPLDAWYNIFVLHQNRVAHSQGAKNVIREGYLARFLDFVVWGHEHECLADPWESTEGDCHFNVIQPGSSVATALSEGESKRKHVVMLEVMGENWRTVKLPLESVRPFAFDSTALADQLELDPEEDEAITRFLEAKVDSMIRTAMQRRPVGREAMLPLVRLRVDYTGFSTINVQRFGQRYVGKVANPHDILIWHKAPQRRAKEEGAPTAGPRAGLRPPELDERQIEELIGENLAAQLEILPEPELAAALHNFVDKDEKAALADCVRTALVETQNAAVAERGGEAGAATAPAEDDLAQAVARSAAQRRTAAQVNATMARAAASLPSIPATDGAGPSSSADGDASAMDVDDSGARMPPPAPRGGAAGPTGVARGGGAAGGARQATLGEAFGRGKGPARAAQAASPSAAAASNLPESSAGGRRGGRRAAAPSPSQTGLTQRSVAGGRSSARKASAAAAQRISSVTRDLSRSGEDAIELSESEDEVELDEEEDDDDDEEGSYGGRTAPRKRLAVQRAGGTRGAAGAAGTAGTRRGRGAAATGQNSNAAANGAAPAPHRGGSFVVDSDEEDAPARGGAAPTPVARLQFGRRRALASQRGAAAGSQAGSLPATAPSQPTGKGWGALR